MHVGLPTTQGGSQQLECQIQYKNTSDPPLSWFLDVPRLYVTNLYLVITVKRVAKLSCHMAHINVVHVQAALGSIHQPNSQWHKSWKFANCATQGVIYFLCSTL